MPTVQCRLGQDAADAAGTRPAVVLTAAEVAVLLAPGARELTPALAALLAAPEDGPATRAVGAGQLPGLRAELRRALDGIAASRLPGQLLLALAWQRLATVCGTALELGLNLYLTVEGAGIEGGEPPDSGR